MNDAEQTRNDILWDFLALRRDVERAIASVEDAASLERVRVAYLGRKGLVPKIFSSLGQAPQEKRPALGKEANQFRAFIEDLLRQKKETLSAQTRETVSSPAVDVTLPGVSRPVGHAHLLTQVMEEICDIFRALGFSIQQGPEIETEFHNFTALNIPADHPSRDAFDTFYLQQKPSAKHGPLLLRSHTSPGQIRILTQHKPPLAVLIPGKVYRPDAVDATHSFMFHQVEGLLVDRQVTFADLKGLIAEFCRRFFGDKIAMRFRPHFFPFTEPSAEVDISSRALGKKDWLEIMGCGLVHPHVFESSGYPKGQYTGLAFGMGVERMAMLKYRIQDIRVFTDNDVRFLQQF